MNTAEIAAKALEILDRDGWCKGTKNYEIAMISAGKTQEYRMGSHCIGGAWEHASEVELHVINTEEYMPLINKIREQYPEVDDLIREEKIFQDLPIRAITMFNDMDDTTETDVRAILEKLAAGG